MKNKLEKIPEFWFDENNNKNILVSYVCDCGNILIIYKTISEEDIFYSIDFYEHIEKYF